jgi:hypothetical protein
VIANAQQLLTALSHGRPIAAVPVEIDREGLYGRMPPPRTHDMHWDHESSFVPIVPGARSE